MFILKVKNWLISLFAKSTEYSYDPMKYLIVGLGNIGSKYDGTRHNIGFDVLNELASQKEAQWKTVSLGDMTEIKHKGRTILLLKPSTYMNLSGKAVRFWSQKHKVPESNLLIIVDDLNLDLGLRRLRAKGSDGGHNGLKDIQAILGHSNYPRLRLGIGSSYSKGKQINFVLGKWEDEEMETVNSMLKASIKCILDFVSLEFKFAVNNCSGKS